MTTEDRKNEILDYLGYLFGDADADRQEQIDAMEEIADRCREDAEMLKEDLRNRE